MQRRSWWRVPCTREHARRAAMARWWARRQRRLRPRRARRRQMARQPQRTRGRPRGARGGWTGGLPRRRGGLPRRPPMPRARPPRHRRRHRRGRSQRPPQGSAASSMTIPIAERRSKRRRGARCESRWPRGIGSLRAPYRARANARAHRAFATAAAAVLPPTPCVRARM